MFTCAQPRAAVPQVWKILKSRFQNRLVSESGFVKMSYFASRFWLNFLDGRTRFAYNSHQAVTLQICGPSLGPQVRQVLEATWLDTESGIGGGAPGGLAPPGLWPHVWVPASAASNGLECVLIRMHFRAIHRHRH